MARCKYPEAFRQQLIPLVRAGRTTEALRFDMRGVISARLQLPVELEVYEIGTDYLLGGALLPDGQPSVQLYRFLNSDS